MSVIEKLSIDIANMINAYNDNRKHASTSETCYRDCEQIMTRINALCGFSERYLEYKIIISKGRKGNQYTPCEILGYKIEKAGGNNGKVY